MGKLSSFFSALVLCVLALFTYTGTAQASAGDLDSSFGTGGKVTSDFGNGEDDAATSVVLQPDGKIIVAGGTNDTSFHIALARYNPDGSPDTSFGSGGQVTTSIGLMDAASTVLLQPDGKIIVVGASINILMNTDFAVVRYNSNGTLDSTFGSGGTLTTDFSGYEDIAFAAVLQSDGKIIAAGYSSQNSSGSVKYFALARYNTNGALDSGFGTGGKVTTSFFGYVDEIFDVGLQPDGKILAAGYSNNGFSDDFALARYTTGGTLDTSFGLQNGRTTTDFMGGTDQAGAMTQQSDGKILLAGKSNSDFALARYTSDGYPDYPFGYMGTVTADFATSDDAALAVGIQSDGKILTAGQTQNGTYYDFAFARFNTNGSLDPTYGTGGKSTTDFSGYNDAVAALVLQPDDKVIAVGASSDGTSYDFAVSRHLLCGDIVLSPADLPDAQLGVYYSQTVSASGGSEPYTYSISSGSLPDGLTLDPSTGAITGTPTSGGAFSFTITALDALGCSASAAYTVSTICVGMTLSPDSLPAAEEGSYYNQTVTATGGSTPYSYSIVTGALPAGLTLDANSGVISGTPPHGSAGSYDFTLAATDSIDCFATKDYTIAVTAAPCLFCDDFEDSDLDLTWTYLKPEWSETGGALVGSPTGRKAIAIATPAFAGCLDCSIASGMQSAGGDYNKMWLLGWYTDKRNTVELLMKQENNKWILRQRSNGTIVAKVKGLKTISPNTPYAVLLAFDGTDILLYVDDMVTPLAVLHPAVPLVTGTVGYYVKSTIGTFGYILVN